MPRKYTVDASFFDVIDSEEKAYWLGFLTADGVISNVSSLRLHLKAGDSERLEKFAKSILSNAPIKDWMAKAKGKEYPSAYIDIHSTELTKSLSKFGIVQNKGKTVLPPDLSIELMTHYWRGVFDGDGCISRPIKYDNCASQWRFVLCGNLHIVNGFKDFVCSTVDGNPQIVFRGNVHYVTFGGKQVATAVAKKLYRYAHVYLERKCELAKELINLGDVKLVNNEVVSCNTSMDSF